VDTLDDTTTLVVKWNGHFSVGFSRMDNAKAKGEVGPAKKGEFFLVFLLFAEN